MSHTSEKSTQAHKKQKITTMDTVLCFISGKSNYAISCLIDNELHIIIDRCKAVDSFERALTYYNPTLVLLSSKNEYEIEICELRQLVYELRPNMEFDSRNGSALLCQHCNLDAMELEQLVSFDQTFIKSCSAVLLSHALNIGRELKISSIVPSDIDACMLLNEDAFISLDIFERENKPNQQSKGNNLSLFGIMNKTKSHCGYKTLIQWFRCPSTDKSIILNRQSAIEELLKAANDRLTDKLINLLCFKSPERIMMDISPGSGEFEWKSLLLFGESVFKIHQILQEISLGDPDNCLLLLDKELDLKSINDVCNAIRQAIDFERSALENRVCVKLGLDEELDNLRGKYDTISNELTKASEEILTRYVLSSMFPLAESLNVVYFPQIGFLTSLTFQNNEFPDNMDNAHWEIQFTSENAVYFKNE